MLPAPHCSSPEVVTRARNESALQQKIASLERENARLVQDNSKLMSALDASVPRLSYDSVINGSCVVGVVSGIGIGDVPDVSKNEFSKAVSNIPVDKLVGLVESMEACGVDKVWEQCVKATSNSAKKAIKFGMQNAVTMVLVRTATNITHNMATWAFGFDQADRRWLGDLFKVTLKVCNRHYARTVAMIPTLQHLDLREMPSFLAPMLSNFATTLDATNIGLTFRILNADGSKDSYSDYYGANCGKVEIGSLNDATVGWVSLTYGGAASEINIVEGKASEGEGVPHVSFREFYADLEKRQAAGHCDFHCTQTVERQQQSLHSDDAHPFRPTCCPSHTRCVDADGTPFKPGVLADKGTKVRPVCDSLGADYLTPSQLGKDGVLTYQEVTSNEEISKARGHVERVIGEIKRFQMLKGIPHRLAYLVDEIVYFCAYSTLFF